MEDELWRVFGDKSQNRLLSVWEDDMTLDSRILTKGIEKTQKRMESHYFEIRKNVLQYDDVMNVQREVIYGQRRQILEGADLRQTVEEYMHKTISGSVDAYCLESLQPSEWDTKALFNVLHEICPPISSYVGPDDLKLKNAEDIKTLLIDVADKAYKEREKELTPELMRELERHIALRAINSKWMEHLDAMDYLREGIGLRGYAQIDPLVAYKKEAFGMFDQMLESIQDEIVQMMYRVQIQREPEPYRNPYRNVQMTGGDFVPSGMDNQPIAGGGQGPSPAIPAHRTLKTGRNDLCPCGSGKKYKKCCLKDDL